MTKPIPTRTTTLTEARELQTDTLGFVMKIAEEMGDFCLLKVGFWDIYFVNHPDYIQHVFLDNWKNYGRDTFQFNNFARVTGKGMLTTHGDYWQQQRRLAQPGFHKSKLDGMAQQMASAIDRMHGRWNDQLEGQDSIQVDLDSEMLRLGLEIVGSALFSINFTQDSAVLSQEILSMMQYVVYRSQNLLAPPTWVPTPRNVRFNQTLRKVNRIIFDLIEGRRQSTAQHNDLLSLFLDGRDANGQPLPNQAIRDEIITMIIAGYETVASGMGWMWSTLSRYPKVEAKIREEIATVNGSVSSQIVNEHPYSSAAINEVFRLYPPSWLITRKTQSADKIGPYEVPAGAITVVCPYAIHRHASFWPQPNRFDPDRYLADYANFKKYAYIPFGGGPHLCIGRPFAKLEAGLTLIQTLKQFKLTPIEAQTPSVNAQVTLRPKDRLLMDIRPI